MDSIAETLSGADKVWPRANEFKGSANPKVYFLRNT